MAFCSNRFPAAAAEADAFIALQSNLIPSGEYVCLICQKTVRNKGNLIQHMEVQHLPKEKWTPEVHSRGDAEESTDFDHHYEHSDGIDGKIVEG